MCFRRKREGNGSAFLGGFKGEEMWGEIGATADSTKMGAKGIGNFKGVCN